MKWIYKRIDPVAEKVCVSPTHWATIIEIKENILLILVIPVGEGNRGLQRKHEVLSQLVRITDHAMQADNSLLDGLKASDIGQVPQRFPEIPVK